MMPRYTQFVPRSLQGQMQAGPEYWGPHGRN